MGLQTWKNHPHGKIRQTDVTVAKNYLTADELDGLNRIVTMYLDFAEDQARRKQPMTMTQWTQRLDAFLAFNERDVLDHAGKVEKAVADRLAKTEFDTYQQQQRQLGANDKPSDFDRFVDDLKQIDLPNDDTND